MEACESLSNISNIGEAIMIGTSYFRHCIRKNKMSKIREIVLWDEIKLTVKNLK